MKRPVLLLIAVSCFSLTCRTSHASAQTSQNTITETARDKQVRLQEARVKDLQDWYQMHEKLGETWPVKPKFQSDMPTESDFLREFKAKNLDDSYEATGSGNGGDPMAADFVSKARSAISGCGIEEKLRREYPRQWRDLDRRFYKVRVRSVSFNLCVDDSSKCDFSSSFAAKNYPKLNLILVNAFKWNLMYPLDRMRLAAHEFLGIIGVERGTYGLSDNFQLRTAYKHLSGNAIEAETTCESLNPWHIAGQTLRGR